MLKQADMFGSDVPLASPGEGHVLWELAVIMPGSSKNEYILVYLFQFMPMDNWAPANTQVQHQSLQTLRLIASETCASIILRNAGSQDGCLKS